MTNIRDLRGKSIKEVLCSSTSKDILYVKFCVDSGEDILMKFFIYSDIDGDHRIGRLGIENCENISLFQKYQLKLITVEEFAKKNNERIKCDEDHAYEQAKKRVKQYELENNIS